MNSKYVTSLLLEWHPSYVGEPDASLLMSVCLGMKRAGIHDHETNKGSTLLLKSNSVATVLFWGPQCGLGSVPD